MPPQSFVVRQLKQVGRPVYEARPERGFRDPMGTTSAAAGPVYEIEAQELRLSADEVAEGLALHELHTTDLVLVDGSWMTLAESPPFFEVAEPHARREQRIRAARGALLIFASACLYGVYFWIRVFVGH